MDKPAQVLRRLDRTWRQAADPVPIPAPVEYSGVYIDPDVESGTEYVTPPIGDHVLGLEGPRSEEMRAIPMALDRRELW